MHSLSTPTWFIHILTLIEWILAIILIAQISAREKIYRNLIWLAFAMLPNLASAMAAITWHVYDNSTTLYGLVYIQALLTFIGNCCLAIAAWKIVSIEREAIE
ncbi:MULTISPECIES: DUF2499 domain-containing protein [unclassified Prochlorococcus]|uniref:DUF2499 domain-containing protein n=1 Tax=unclassified Prochlorococcus TaxID=2627481 RepID=UPI0005336E88|nr:MULTISPECIES: DUF2499 domain-containing protein [unclassified Prochlorococcus]KGG15251.1 hypothetical protein EV06_1122 [Prochlorococcus sp. MIT 0602]KGG17528.1 hypothetical protein EV07_0968 [Prochlorococcus sp. MIT 0603]